MFTVQATSDRIWNLVQLIEHLVENQGKTVDLKVNPEAVCLRNLKLYEILDCFKFQQVNIHTNNPLESHDRYNICFVKSYHWFNRFAPIAEDLHTWNQSKVFFCLFGRPTASRLGLAGYLNSHHANQSLIHFSTTTHSDELVKFELDKLLDYHPNSIVHAGEIINQLPMLLSSSDTYTQFNGYDYTDPLSNFYRDILIDIVVESHVVGRTFYATEKTVRSMLMKKPFIAFASQNYLDYLHQMGFKTFCNFWDEIYDGFETRNRFVRILELIDLLAHKSTAELTDMYIAMQPVLEHNYNMLINQTYNTDITEII